MVSIIFVCAKTENDPIRNVSLRMIWILNQLFMDQPWSTWDELLQVREPSPEADVEVEDEDRDMAGYSDKEPENGGYRTQAWLV